jgi:large subunit ribosomal protein L24
MKQSFSPHWIRSKQPRKQRKYRFNAPLHIKREFFSALLSKELRKKYGTKHIIVKKGDKVKILRGQYKNKIGKVEKVNLKRERIFVQGAERTKKDGSKSFYPIHPSKVQIQEMVLDDKKRKKSLERNTHGKKSY